RQARGDAARSRDRPAPRYDAARHGDRIPGRGCTAERCTSAGEQRPPRPDGGPLPAARRHGWKPFVTFSPETGHPQVTPHALIRNVRLYGEGDVVDVLVDDEQIRATGPDLEADAAAEILEGAGQILLPGFVDLH